LVWHPATPNTIYSSAEAARPVEFHPFGAPAAFARSIVAADHGRSAADACIAEHRRQTGARAFGRSTTAVTLRPRHRVVEFLVLRRKTRAMDLGCNGSPEPSDSRPWARRSAVAGGPRRTAEESRAAARSRRDRSLTYREPGRQDWMVPYRRSPSTLHTPAPCPRPTASRPGSKCSAQPRRAAAAGRRPRPGRGGHRRFQEPPDRTPRSGLTRRSAPLPPVLASGGAAPNCQPRPGREREGKTCSAFPLRPR